MMYNVPNEPALGKGNPIEALNTTPLETLAGFIPVVPRRRTGRTNRQRIAAFLIKRTLSAKIKLLNEIKTHYLNFEFFGLEPVTESDLKYVNYLLAVLYQRRDAQKVHRTYVAQKQQQRRAEWLEYKRAERYQQNHRYGELSHDWLNYKIMRRTGCTTGDGFEKPVPYSPCCEFECEDRLSRLGLRPSCLSGDVSPIKIKTKPIRKVEVPLPKWDKQNFKNFQEPISPPRSQYLLAKLRAKIALLRQVRCVSSGELPQEDFNRAFIKRVFKYAPRTPIYHNGVSETDGAHGDDQGLTVDQASNVVLTRQSDESTGAPEAVNTQRPLNLATSDQHPQYDDFMDRYILLDTINWKDTSLQNDTLKSYSLPFDIVDKRAKSPNMSFFKLFQYVQCDMEIKVQINAQPMAQGQLQVAWRYMDDFDNNADWYTSVQCLSQTDHVLISVNDENPGCLYIPYRYVKPMLSTTVRSDQDKPLRMGRLYVKVLNPLYTSATSCGDVDVSIWVRFLNGKFAGMTSRDVGKLRHQGIWEDIKQAEFHLNLDAKINNKDKPPIQTGQPLMVINSNQSYSAGTNTTEPLNALRLDMRGQGTNVEGQSDDMKIQKIVRTFGFVRTLKWHVCDTSSKLLTIIDASPMFNLNEYAQGVVETEHYFNLPPVATISEMFLYWRGSLELRIDAVATAFHKGKLMVCYVPRVIENITMEQALGCPHVIFDLSQQKQFSFTVPWITNQHYWNRRYGVRESKDQTKPPGKIYIFIQNKLSKQDNVRDSVDLNLYWRGGEDFSVAVPATSALSLPWNAAKSSTGNTIRAGPGYAPYYVGCWRYFYGNRPILRYGTGADHVTQFINIPKEIDNCYFKYNETEGKPLMWQSLVFKYGVIVADDNYRYMAMCTTEDEAKNYLNYQKYPEWKHNAADALQLIVDDDKGTWGGKVNPDWVLINYTPVAPPKPPSSLDFELVHHHGEKDSVQAPPVSLTTGNYFVDNASQESFGENFTDLKDLCRRYQPYCSISLTTNRYASPVDKILPISPCGLSLGSIDGAKAEDRYKYLKREGHIPLICSGYRFYRGGLRFRLPIAHSEAQIFLTHLPEKQGLSDIQTPAANTFDAFYSPTYASYVQSTHVNPVVAIEVPFYNANNSIFPNQLHSSGLKEMQGLLDMGTLAIGASSQINQISESHGILFYSFADDAMLTCFQGFPSLILRSEGYTDIQHNGFLDFFKWEPTLKVDVGLQDVLDSPQLKELSESLKEFGVSNTQIILNQIIHVAINPTVTTLAWSVVSMLIHLKIFTFEYFSKLVPIFETLTIKLRALNIFKFSCSTPSSPNEPSQRREYVRTEHNASNDEMITDIATLIATLFSVLSIFLGIKNVKKPKSFVKFVTLIIGGLAVTAKSYQSIILFFVNIIKLFKKLTEYITMWLNPELLLDKLINEETPILQMWTTEALALLNIENEDKVYTLGSMWAERMETNYVLGSKIYKSVQNYNGKTIKREQLQPFLTLFKQICDKRDQMYRRGKSVVARKDPFCVYLAGPPGIGKSIMATKLTMGLLKEASIPVLGEPIFTLPNGAKYWNGCRNQPAILIDDFLSVNTGTIQEEAIRAFMEIKSAAVLNPPMASLTEKDLRYAPELVTVLANSTFPVVNHANLEAIYRRRDALIKVELSKKLKEAGVLRISEYTKAELENQFNIDMSNFEHLEFYMASDVTGGIAYAGSPSDEGAKYCGPYTYLELYRKLIYQFIEHSQNQEELYQMRVAQLDEFIIEDNEDVAGLDEKLKEFKSILQMMRDLPYKPHTNYLDYLRLIEMASRGEPITDDKILELIDIRARTMERIRAAIDKQKSHLLKQAEEVSSDMLDPDAPQHNGPTIFSGVYSKVNREKTVKETIEYCLKTGMALYKKQLGVRIKTRYGGERIKYISAYTEMRAAAMMSIIKERFTMLRGLDVTVDSNENTPIFHIVWDKTPTSTTLESDLALFQVQLKEQELPEYAPTSTIATMNEYEVDAEYHHMLVHIMEQRFSFTHYRRLLIDERVRTFMYSMLDKNVQQLFDIVMGGADERTFFNMQFAVNTLLKLQCSDRAVFNSTFQHYRLNPKFIWQTCGEIITSSLIQQLFKQEYFNRLYEQAEAGAAHFDFQDITAKLQQVFIAITSAGIPALPDEIKAIYWGNVRSEKLECKHILFTCNAVWDRTSWMQVTYNNDGTEIACIPDDPCTKPSINCVWQLPHIKRYMAQMWKLCNKSQYNVIMSGNHKPKLFTTIGAIDATFWENLVLLFEKGWLWLKAIAAITCVVLIGICLILGPILALVLKVYYLFKIFNHFFGAGKDFSEDPDDFNMFDHTRDRHFAKEYLRNQFFDHQGYSSETHRGGAHPRGNTYTRFFNKAEHNGSVNESLTQLYNKILRNTYWVTSIEGGAKFRVMSLGDRRFIFLKHYWEHFKATGVTELTFRNCATNESFNEVMSNIRFNFHPENSCGVATCTNNSPLHKHLYKRFQALRHTKLTPKRGIFLECDFETKQLIDINIKRRPGIMISASGNFNEQALSDVYEYEYGGPSKCGSVIINPITQEIIGIHVAGRIGQGFGEVFCRETFSELFKVEAPEPLELECVDVNVKPRYQGDYIFHGRVESGLEHHQSGVTQIQRTLIHGVTPVTRAPAPLAKDDPRVPISNYSPLKAGVENMMRPTKDFPNELLNQAAEDLEARILANLDPIFLPIEPLSYHEAICGIDGIQYYDALDFTTSEGFPLSRFRPSGASNKSWLFDRSNPESIGIHQHLQKLMDLEMSNRIKDNKVNHIIHDDCLKDALISKDKIVKSGKTRVFSVSPVSMTIHFKQFFNHFLAAFKAQRIKFEHAIGINANSPEWARLVRHLQETGAVKIVTGDYSNFGPALNKNCLYKAFDIMINWTLKYMGQTNSTYKRIMTIMREEICSAYHLAYDQIYQVKCGLPSGNPATVELNSLVNMLYIRCAWLSIMKTAKVGHVYCLDHYYSHVRLITYGDDLIMSVTDEIAEYFNSQTLSKFFAKYDIKYTDALKSGEIIKYDTLENSQFLKRSFIKHPIFTNMWLAPLEWDCVTDTPNWCKRYLSLEDGTKESVCASLAEAYGHGPTKFNELRSKLRLALIECKIDCTLRTWDDWDTIHFADLHNS